MTMGSEEDLSFDMNMLAYCGLYCEQCSARIAFAEQDPAHMDHIPAKYKRVPFDLSDYDCEGCKGRNLCGPCKIKDCAAPKGIDSCAECAEYPCAVLDAFENDGAPHHKQAGENLRSIRENGVNVWFAHLTPALRCHCGRRQSWYHLCPVHQTGASPRSI